MVIRTTPSPLLWLIGVELGRYRSAARLSLSKASDLVGISKPKLSHLETGRQNQTRDDIALLLKAYGADEKEIDRLSSLVDRVDEAVWWCGSERAVPDWLKTFVGLERIATREFVFEPTAIPGLLQHKDYARELTATSRRVRPDDRDLVVDFRMARAERLVSSQSPLKFHAVMTEGALRLDIGSVEVRRMQFEHLVALAHRPNITIQILRPEDGAHTALAGPFVLLDFEKAHSIGYAELYGSAIYIQHPDEVRTYVVTGQNVSEVALNPERSVELLESMIDAM